MTVRLADRGSGMQSITYAINCPMLVTVGRAGVKLGWHIGLPDEKTSLCNLGLTLWQGAVDYSEAHGDNTWDLQELSA